MDNNRNEMPIFLDSQVEIFTLLQDMLVNWWMILLGALAGAMLMYVVTSVQYEPQYTTQATFVVSSKTDSNVYSNLSSANSMALTLQKILESTIMEKTICSELGMEELNAEIGAEVLEGTNMLVLTVTADTPGNSIDIIRAIMENYSSISVYTTGSAVMDVMQEPSIPYSPNKQLNTKTPMKKGALAGGGLVALLLLLMSYLKETIKQEREIEQKLDARSLGSIRYERKYKTLSALLRRKKHTVLVDSPVSTFRFVENYKRLAAKVEYQMEKNDRKVLVVTSVAENEGKSTVAANLALALLERSKKVLLIDGDIRRPSQFLILGVKPEEKNELGEFLKGKGVLGDVLLKTDRKNLFFIGGRNCYSTSTEFLHSPRTEKLIKACRSAVDYIIIDTPPAGLIGDAQVLGSCADAMLLVTKQNYMLAEDINEVLDEFRGNNTKVLGVVLNQVRTFEDLLESPTGRYGKYAKYEGYGRTSSS